MYISRQIGFFHTQTAFSYAKVHGPRTETRQDPTQTHQRTWSGVAVLWGLSKKRKKPRMGANGADGTDGPNGGGDGAIGTNATDSRAALEAMGFRVRRLPVGFCLRFFVFL